MLQRMGTNAHPHNICFWSRARLRVKPASCFAFSRTTHVQSHEPSHVPTPVEKIIRDSIIASGPIPVSTYMQLCLSHPTEGYYTKQRPDDSDVFGVKGDFITSPEISQAFGELVGLWLLSMWRNTETSLLFPKLRLIELGPGRGTLMDDILRTLSMWPDSGAAVNSVHMVENSFAMRSRQAQKLAARRESQNIQLHWWDSIEDIPDASDDEFTMIVAHEFFDALPKTPNGFREILIDLQPSQMKTSVISSTTSASTVPSSSQLRFVVSSAPTARSDFLSTLSPRFASLPVGSRVEVCSSGWRVARKIGEMVADHGKVASDARKRFSFKGAALIMDYGAEHAFGASFRAFRAHCHVDVFEKPGMSDLTTNVDFALLKEALEDVATKHGTLDQASFLLRMGLIQRLAALMKVAQNEKRRLEIDRAGQRLVDPAGQGMGRVYRVLGVTGKTGAQVEVWPFISQPHADQTDGEK